MLTNRTVVEELAFKTAELDAALQEAGFALVFSDPEAARDFSYRARYLRTKSTLYPALHAMIEYYSATKAYSLKLSASDDAENKVYLFLIKNYRGDLKKLLEHYYASVRRGVPFKPEDLKE